MLANHVKIQLTMLCVLGFHAKPLALITLMIWLVSEKYLVMILFYHFDHSFLSALDQNNKYLHEINPLS